MRSCDTGFRTKFACEIYQVSEAGSKGCVPPAMAELSASRGGAGVAKSRDTARKSAGATACIKPSSAGESPMGADLSRVDGFSATYALLQPVLLLSNNRTWGQSTRFHFRGWGKKTGQTA